MHALRSFGVALAALAGTVVVAVASTMTTLVTLATTALIMGGTGMKVVGGPHQWGSGTYLDQVNDTYLDLDPAALQWVATPEHFWPATGLTDVSFDTSVMRGVLALDGAIRATPGSKIVVGYSQSANIATREKRHLEELRANGTVGVPLPDELSFVFIANPNRPNGGILARFEGLYIPILGVSFDGATPDDGYPAIDVARQYDLVADFPKYPLNLLADLNALMGYFYLHPNYGSAVVDLTDPSTYQSHTAGNTTYYLVHTENLPLLQPLRDIGFPEPALDLVEPALRVMIELAYDRTPENMGVPTRAGLLPDIDADKLASDLTAALRQGVHDTLDGLGIDTTRPSRQVETAAGTSNRHITAKTPSAEADPDTARPAPSIDTRDTDTEASATKPPAVTSPEPDEPDDASTPASQAPDRTKSAGVQPQPRHRHRPDRPGVARESQPSPEPADSDGDGRARED
ncbi:PE-PPE domain-containing protein [Mycolicibacterium sp. XJ870]